MSTRPEPDRPGSHTIGGIPDALRGSRSGRHHDHRPRDRGDARGDPSVHPSPRRTVTGRQDHTGAAGSRGDGATVALRLGGRPDTA
jgi:hypothetical protein